MSLASLTAPEANRRRGRTAKAPKSQGAKPIKASLYLSAEAAKRLGIHSTMEGKSQSAIVEALIQEHLRRWVVQDRAKPTVGGNPDDQASTVEMIGNG